MPVPIAPHDPTWTLYVPLVTLTVAVLVGCLWAYHVFQGLKGGDEEGATTPDDLLTPLVEAYRAGQMSEEEYLRIRGSIERDAGRLPDPAYLVKPPKPTGVTEVSPNEPNPADEAH